MSDRNQLVASYFTLTGTPVGQPPRFSFEDRVAAAAAAGFAGIGLLADEYLALQAAGRRDVELRQILDDHGVRIVEVEFAYGWSDGGSSVDDLEVALLSMADAFSPHHLTCGDIRPVSDAPPRDVLIERFAALCDRAAEHGTRVAVEFLPWSVIPDLRTAWAIVDGAGRANGGVLLDAWHYFRGAPDETLLRSLPSSAVVGVQLDDADEPDGPAMEDTILRRRLPGAGTFDLVGLVSTRSMRSASTCPIRSRSCRARSRPAPSTRRLDGPTTRPPRCCDGPGLRSTDRSSRRAGAQRLALRGR